MYSEKKGCFSFDGQKVSAETVRQCLAVSEYRFRSSGYPFLRFYLPDGVKRDYPSTYRNCRLVERLRGPIIERRG